MANELLLICDFRSFIVLFCDSIIFCNSLINELLLFVLFNKFNLLINSLFLFFSIVNSFSKLFLILINSSNLFFSLFNSFFNFNISLFNFLISSFINLF